MLYDVELSKDNMNDCSEYLKIEQNKITKSSQTEQVSMDNNITTCNENLLEFVAPYKNKAVTVHLEFPEYQDEETVTDFISRLKIIYFEKIKKQSMQGGNTALYSQTTNEEEGNTNG